MDELAQPERALSDNDEQREIDRLLSDMERTPFTAGLQLVALLHRVGQRANQAGDIDRALEHGQKALLIAARLSESGIELPLAQTYTRLANWTMSSKSLKESHPLFAKALISWRIVAERNPGNFRDELAVAMSQTARSGADRLARSEILNLLEDAASEWKRLAADDRSKYVHKYVRILKDLEFELGGSLSENSYRRRGVIRREITKLTLRGIRLSALRCLALFRFRRQGSQ